MSQILNITLILPLYTFCSFCFFCCPFCRFFLQTTFSAAVHPCVEHRDEYQCHQRGQCQTKNNADCHGAHHFAAFLLGEYQREHTKDGGQCGHEDRAQTTGTCCGEGVIAPHASVHELIGIVDEDDTIVYNHTCQHDKAHHGCHGDGVAGNEQTQDGTGKCQRAWKP